MLLREVLLVILRVHLLLCLVSGACVCGWEGYAVLHMQCVCVWLGGLRCASHAVSVCVVGRVTLCFTCSACVCGWEGYAVLHMQ